MKSLLIASALTLSSMGAIAQTAALCGNIASLGKLTQALRQQNNPIFENTATVMAYSLEANKSRLTKGEISQAQLDKLMNQIEFVTVKVYSMPISLTPAAVSSYVNSACLIDPPV